MGTITPSSLMLLGIPIAMSTISLAMLHWYPWNKGTRPLPRIRAYTVGTAVVVGFPVAAMLAAVALHAPQGELFWAALLLLNTLASGATVNIAYWIDGNRAISTEEASDGDGT